MAIVTAFRPLLRKLASQERDYTLRTDLSSQLVLGTLEAIRKFPGTDSRRFPGFLKKHLTFLLSHYKRKQQRWNRLKEKIYALESHETTVTVSLPSCSSLLVIGLVQLLTYTSDLSKSCSSLLVIGLVQLSIRKVVQPMGCSSLLVIGLVQ